MAEPVRLGLYTIPTHRAFADALVAGLMRRFGGDPMALARGLVLVPNNRARRTITDAFVRASGGGLLLPRLVAIGDPAIDEALGAFLDPADAEPVPPAVSPIERRMILARLVGEARGGDAAEAVRLAGELARTLDQMLLEEVDPARLRALEMADPLSEHWQRALQSFALVLDRWPGELARLGRIDGATRRGLLLSRLAERWRVSPPPGFVCAAGINDPAPTVARLLRVVAGLRHGMVVLPGLGTAMPDAQWQALGPHRPDERGFTRRSIETHPQFHLKLLLDRMGVDRGEFTTWTVGSGHDAPATRTRAIDNAMAPAAFTHGWSELKSEERRFSGVRFAALATSAEEAQAIALALREALETPGYTAALVTPDRALATRVAAHLARWEIAIDDSAGRPLSLTPPGGLLLALVEAATQRFAPLALLALLKHPLVRAGEARGGWLDSVRMLDRVLRGPRPAAGLASIDAYLADGERDATLRRSAALWWPEARDLLAPLENVWATGPQPLGGLLQSVREAAAALCGDALWAGPAGRAAAELLAELEAHAGVGPARVDPAALGPMLRTLTDEQAVRPPQGGHPRLAIYGLIEARLQTADLMVLGGLNEGTWPGLPAPDPWLAPRIRTELGLAGLDRRIGIAAHDFALSLGAPRVLVTRARRTASGPATASRLWLRLQALAGRQFETAAEVVGWVRAIDAPAEFTPAVQPAPAPAVSLRPKSISVTEVDRLKADPFAFYARRMLRLAPLDPVDAEPSAAWRGSEVHAILEQWAVEDRCDPALLGARAEAMLADERTHPLVRALWAPRLKEAIDWIAAQMAEQAASGRKVLAVEGAGEVAVAGVTLKGRFDRIDRLPDGTIAVIDYKTGQPPSAKAIRAGYSLQLGLLGLIAERGGFGAEVQGEARGFEYWSLARKAGGGLGFIESPVDPKKRDPIPAEEFVALALDNFADAARRWLTGDAPFTAKLVPEYAPYAEYDQLMRRDEWYGRERR